MFSQACKYAIRAVILLAQESDENHKKGVRDIVCSLDVPKHFLAKVLQQLSKGNLISSTKGPGGGFYLTQENRNNRLLDIIDMIDGKDAVEGCVLGLPECSSERPCPLHFQAMAYRQGLYHQLNSLTIDQVARAIGPYNFKSIIDNQSSR